jgi:hypothetical protein
VPYSLHAVRNGGEHGGMTTPEGEPTITTPEELRRALAQRFLDNALTGDDEANEALVEAVTAWQGKRTR